MDLTENVLSHSRPWPWACVLGFGLNLVTPWPWLLWPIVNIATFYSDGYT